MSDDGPPRVRLEFPEDVHERVRRAAEGMDKPVEMARLNIVRAATPSLENVLPDDWPELGGIREVQTP